VKRKEGREGGREGGRGRSGVALGKNLTLGGTLEATHAHAGGSEADGGTGSHHWVRCLQTTCSLLLEFLEMNFFFFLDRARDDFAM
jgi:hypothetical protein